MNFETSFQRCVAECSVGGNGGGWRIVAVIVFILSLLLMMASASRSLHGAGQRSGGGVMNLLIVVALVSGIGAFLVPTTATVYITNADQNKCNRECAHLAPKPRQ